MFQKIYYRLLLSYLSVFVLVLGTFAIAVRFAFVHHMKQDTTNKLLLLGRSVAGNARLEGNRLALEYIPSIQSLIQQDQALQWFDLEHNLVAQQGRDAPMLPFSPTKTVQIQEDDDLYIQAVTLPIVHTQTHEVIGYLRVSQSLEVRLDELDMGLGIGMITALIVSSAGSFILTRQAMQPIEKSYQRLKQFTADASHELRSPLMAIKASAQVALRYPEAMRAADAEEFHSILLAADQMARLTEDLLLLARDGIPKQGWNTVDLTKLLMDLIRQYQARAITQNIRLTTQIIRSLKSIGDLSELTRLFRNLLDNAFYYTPSGGTIEVTAQWIDYQICVNVQDTGVGIAPEHLEHVFERFWRADHSRSSKDEKPGLGLAIAKAIVERHNGSIKVTSQPGSGSCFTVYLPSITSKTL